MSKTLQKMLLAVGAGVLLILIIELVLAVVATTHGPIPARVAHVKAGPYPLTVSLYTDPANAGYDLPFAIAPQHRQSGVLTFDVTSVPGTGVVATRVHASLAPDANVRNGVQGAAEITVRGMWNLLVSVDGPQGHAEVSVPVTATAPPAIPLWLGWLIGLIPLYGLLAFMLLQRSRQEKLA